MGIGNYAIILLLHASGGVRFRYYRMGPFTLVPGLIRVRRMKEARNSIRKFEWKTQHYKYPLLKYILNVSFLPIFRTIFKLFIITNGRKSGMQDVEGRGI